MLEELLERKLSPNDSAQALLSFLRTELPAGGTAAERRFLGLFLSLCDNIFGKIRIDDFRHDTSGWFSIVIKPIYGNRQPNQGKAQTDPVQVLLTQELIPALTSEQRFNASYKFPFLALPRATQQAWLSFLEQSFGGKTSTYITENQKTLFGSQEQAALQQYRRFRLQLPEGAPSPKFATRSLSSPLQAPSEKEIRAASSSPSPDIMLSLIQYYLYLLIRYPLAEPSAKSSTSSSSRRYPSQSISKKENYGETLFYQAFTSALKHALPFYEPRANQNVPIMIRIIMALWLETQVIDSTSTVMQRIPSKIDWDLDSSWDMVRSVYSPPCQKVQSCLRTMVIRLVADPALPPKLRVDPWCLSQSMTAMQQAMYNTIRSTFRHASIHVSSSPFHTFLDIWLKWLEPWNVIDKQSKNKRDFSPRKALMVKKKDAPTRVIPSVKFNQRSKYHAAWEPYVAANLYFYLVPLALFLRRARELDFSPKKFESSIKLVGKVLRVFSPDLLGTLQGLVSSRNDIVRRHYENIEPFAPPGLVTLSSLRPDLQKLVEEVYMERNKALREMGWFLRSLGQFESYLFGGKEEQALHHFRVQARYLGQWSEEDFPEPISSTTPAATISRPLPSVDTSHPLRTNDGSLSLQGREQVINGWVVCHPSDVQFHGDPLRVQVRSTEFSILVHLMVALSDRANEMCGLTKDSSMRFNFRFLADLRNMPLISVCLIVAFRYFF